MSRLKRIIVGHDLRAGGEAALKSAALLARHCGAALRLVHVVEPQHFYQRISHPLSSRYSQEQIAQKSGAKLQAFAASPELAQLHVEYEVRRGKPFVELIIARRSWQADLIIVGGTWMEREHALGSTSERVLRKAMVPVLIAKKPLNAEPKTFFVPTDFSDCAKKAAEEALMLAQGFCGRVVFFHAVDLYPSYAISYTDEFGVAVPVPPPPPEELEFAWQDFLFGLPLDKVDWEKYSEEGEPVTTILRQAEINQPDLIVIGTHGRSGLEQMLLGSVAEKVIRETSYPLLAIRPESFKFEMP